MIVQLYPLFRNDNQSELQLKTSGGTDSNSLLIKSTETKNSDPYYLFIHSKLSRIQVCEAVQILRTLLILSLL